MKIIDNRTLEQVLQDGIDHAAQVAAKHARGYFYTIGAVPYNNAGCAYDYARIAAQRTFQLHPELRVAEPSLPTLAIAQGYDAALRIVSARRFDAAGGLDVIWKKLDRVRTYLDSEAKAALAGTFTPEPEPDQPVSSRVNPPNLTPAELAIKAGGLENIAIFGRMDEATKEARDGDFIVSFESIATGTVLFALTPDLKRVADKRRVVIMRRPVEMTPVELDRLVDAIAGEAAAEINGELARMAEKAAAR